MKSFISWERKFSHDRTRTWKTKTDEKWLFDKRGARCANRGYHHHIAKHLHGRLKLYNGHEGFLTPYQEQLKKSKSPDQRRRKKTTYIMQQDEFRNMLTKRWRQLQKRGKDNPRLSHQTERPEVIGWLEPTITVCESVQSILSMKVIVPDLEVTCTQGSSLLGGRRKR